MTPTQFQSLSLRIGHWAFGYSHIEIWAFGYSHIEICQLRIQEKQPPQALSSTLCYSSIKALDPRFLLRPLGVLLSGLRQLDRVLLYRLR